MKGLEGEQGIGLADFLRLYTRPWKIVSFSPEKFPRIQFCVQVAVTTPQRENFRENGTGDKGQDYKIQGDK